MSRSTSPDLRRLTALADELRAELAEARDAGDAVRVERLRGELALLEDLALPEAVSELRLQRITYAGAARAVARPLPPALVAFIG